MSQPARAEAPTPSAPQEAARARADREAAVSGDEVVVTATRTDTRIVDAPATMSVVTGTELRRRPVQDLAEALENEPGIVINGIGMTRRGISIRGMSNEHLLTLVDGRRINDASANMAHVDFDLGWVPSIAIERIEVVRGPLSALYGSEALAGVVNVITRRPDRFEASALSLVGSRDGKGGDTAQLAALVGGPITDTLGVVAWGAYQHRDRTQGAQDPLQSELEGREALSGSIIGWWEPVQGQRFEIGQAAIDDDRARDTVTTSSPILYYEYQDHVTRAQTHGSYTGQWSWGEIQARVYRSVLQRVNERDQDQTPTQATKATNTVGDARITLNVFAGNRLTLGGEHRHETLRDSTVNTAGFKAVDHDALFVQDEWDIREGVSLTAGSRFDHHPNYGWQTSPRAYLVVEPVEGLSFRGGVGKAFKAPSLKQLSLEYITVAAGGRFIITGNPDLKPETSTSYELGTSYTGRGWNVGATLFQNDLHGLVETICVENCGIRGSERRAYVNVDRARVRGVELSGEVTPVATLSLSASYTYVDPRNLSDDQELAERPNHSATVKLAWQPSDATEFNVRGRYIGKQTVYQTVGSASVPVRLDDYDLWSLDASHDLNERLTLKAGVDNVFKKRLAETSALYSFAEPGRIFFVGLGVNL
ncbi:TonB-dependent receptor [Sphingomonas sp. PL-96]|uniref:TonB-dependent receptor domain-containing protein n=1 Tax=Sphingomonas sp. PL-96 TaxID=2887201 RepID=UPI001E4BCA20|nr:TonB-dependent receptor [Sphingomonas sp. PL-96]MCC2977105.1 TonB-dependent receptor [Sphingomonas sp. PL-96]